LTFKSNATLSAKTERTEPLSGGFVSAAAL
jgi:hypothetical protein